MNKAAEKFADLVDIMYRLRSECPWDREQTPESLRQFLLEETYEVLESIDKKDWDSLAGELGDLLLQIVFHGVMAEEKGRFNLQDVIDSINKKMIERHPHVFSDITTDTAEEVVNNWEHIKIKIEQRDSLLSGVPAESPALLQAQRLQEKAANVGFDWSQKKDVIHKIEEEIDELKQAVEQQDKENIAEEFGDLLFSLVNLSRHMNIVSEDALRMANQKFTARFQKIEAHYNNDYQKIKNASLQELDAVWNKAKEKK
jgi:MazG family protein